MGMVVAAFALAKLLGNIPAAYLVDLHGRRPYLIMSCALVGAAHVAIGLADSMEALLAARFIIGLGVTAHIGAMTMYISDISTPLSRAKMIAPGMAGFSAGVALGPAVGGLLHGAVGLQPTFMLVGAVFGGVAAMNSLLLQETMPPGAAPSTSLLSSVRGMMGQWGPLLHDAPVRSLIGFNALYWSTLAGAQMTLLPLMMVGEMGYTAGQVGTAFGFMAGINVLATSQIAKMMGRLGAERTIVVGGSLLVLGVAGIPLDMGMYGLAGSMGSMAVGSACLNTLPTAHMSNITTPETRAQALALLRTAGDAGMLLGSMSAGWLADWSSTGVAFESGAGCLAVATAWYGARTLMSKKIHA